MGIKYAINESFFTKWSPNMAYVLGFFCADGTMIDDKISRGKYIRFINTDKNILLKIKDALNSKHSIYTTPFLNKKAKHVLSIGNKKLFASLAELGLTPNKSLIIVPPPIPKFLIGHFVRGYFDGDGCVHIEKRRNILRIIFTSGSKAFLEGLSKMIASINNIKDKKVYISRRCYQLRYNQRDAIIILKSVYKHTNTGLYLERKKKIFDDFMNNRH